MLSYNPYNVWDGFGHTDTRCFCSYHMYCLEDSPGDKDGQSSVLMQFSVEKPRSTSAVYGITWSVVFRVTCMALCDFDTISDVSMRFRF